jgi:hypothetical protein
VLTTTSSLKRTIQILLRPPSQSATMGSNGHSAACVLHPLSCHETKGNARQDSWPYCPVSEGPSSLSLFHHGGPIALGKLSEKFSPLVLP